MIMAGGSGTRFWPLSRRTRPKQLLRLFGERTMIAETVARFDSLTSPEQILIITADHLVAAIADELELPGTNIVGEPSARNTAPAVGLAAIMAVARSGNPEELVCVFPADHFINNTEAFRRAVVVAAERARSGAIVTMGVSPTHPETGYGYIEAGDRDGAFCEVRSFREKPDADSARTYLSSGDFYWNAGMFFFRADVMLAEIRRQIPPLATALDTINHIADDPTSDAILFTQTWATLDPVSIDYGVMEGAERVEVMPVQFGWSDVGHWDALPEVVDCDVDGNHTTGDVITLDCNDSIICNETGGVVAALGVEGLVIVQTADATLVLPRDRAQEVRRIVDMLNKRANGGELT